MRPAPVEPQGLGRIFPGEVAGAMLETILGKCIMTMAIAAIPVVELRGAIPAGAAAGLDP